MAEVLKAKMAEAEGGADSSTQKQPRSGDAAHVRQSAGGEGSSGCEIVVRFFPHLTMEDPPDLRQGQGQGLDRFHGLWHDLSLHVIRCRVQLV